MFSSDASRVRTPRALATLACAAWLAGCAAPVAPPLTDALGRPSSWSGRFSVTWNAGDAGVEQSASGRFLLTEEGPRTQLELFSPFGQTLARARTDPDGARLDTADGRAFAAPDAESLTQAALGWRMPIGHLPAWLRGDTDPAGARADVAGTHDTVASGWTIRIEPGDAGQPSRVALRWPAPDAPSQTPRVAIRLVLDPRQP